MKKEWLKAGIAFIVGNFKSSGINGRLMGLLRLILAAIFIYAAVRKIGNPLAFGDEIRMYGVLDYGPLLYLTAIVLPWLELICGLSLLTGIYSPGSLLVLTVLNAVFLIAVVKRTAEIMSAGMLFLQVYFDCGCGFGATYAWKKLLENAALFLMAGGLFFCLMRGGSPSLLKKT
ncbi:MAG: hypothetical protein EHM45_21160 [Desulfobacteraceae bacterium]|nr:MAG: hypothetical protein EHM45_21160 [Desulfobacteraceae bacterium]